MIEKDAVAFIKYLHDLEKKFAGSLFETAEKNLVEEIRVSFLKNYKGKK